MILAVTGHRPEKLGGYTLESSRLVSRFALRTIEEIKPTEVITGMAIGWDQAVAYACLILNIPFHAYVPFPGQESRWILASQVDYNYLLARATTVTTCSTRYSSYAFQKRNEMMVDNCDELLALWNGSDGGTENCVRYAQKVGVRYINYWLKWKEFCGECS